MNKQPLAHNSLIIKKIVQQIVLSLENTNVWDYYTLNYGKQKMLIRNCQMFIIEVLTINMILISIRRCQILYYEIANIKKLISHQEQIGKSIDIETFGMHKTNTIDYLITNILMLAIR